MMCERARSEYRSTTCELALSQIWISMTTTCASDGAFSATIVIIAFPLCCRSVHAGPMLGLLTGVHGGVGGVAREVGGREGKMD